MKKILFGMSAVLVALSSVAAEVPYEPSPACLKARAEFREMGLGIFVHWGLYALFGQGEWHLNNGNDKNEYARAAQAFYPSRFNADEWVRTFKAAGAKYVCFTARHHDGFSMWHTKASDYHIGNTPFKRDVVKELADACRRHGLKLHLYYSLLDWTRDDYPVGREGKKVKGRDFSKADYESYLAFMKAQLTELLTQYGDIGCIWFDGWWDHDPRWVKDPTTVAPLDWRERELYDLIHRLQPGCLVANNHHVDVKPGEDIQIFEGDAPGENKAGFNKDAAISDRLPLETCDTISGSWGYIYRPTKGKTAAEAAALYDKLRAKGANLLLNVGPRADGSLPDDSVKTLRGMGTILCTRAEVKKPYVPTAENLTAREAFAAMRLGIFIHWGLYAIPGQGEWYLNNGGVKASEYAQLMGAFNPVNFDARAWAKTFKRSGAGYVCLTTRHHDGFSLFATKASDFNVMNTPYGRDVVKELSDACRAEGLRFHLYYSLLDWTREDYPWQGAKTGAKTGRDPSRQEYDSYLGFMKSQITELLTNYGPVGAIWFDGDWDRKGADWRYDEIYALIHRLQPACLVANNHHHAALPGEDIQVFERDVPGENKAGFSEGQSVEKTIPLETCMTLKNSFNWGYDLNGGNGWMYPSLVRVNLCNVGAKGANVLYNVGPRPDGSLPEQAVARLEMLGDFLDKFSEAIRGTTAGGITDPENRFVTTRRGRTVYYLFTKSGTYRNCDLPVVGDVVSVAEVASGKTIAWKANGNGTIRLETPFSVAAPDYVCGLRVTMKE